ncbi:MAG: anhydro-N-acetylmuramic acid kinase [Candidatus Omnitrophota bacterium]
MSVDYTLFDGCRQLRQAAGRQPLLGIGLMSGTSIDAVDAAVVRFAPCGDLPITLMGYVEKEIPPEWRERILLAMNPTKSSTPLVCQLNMELGKLFAEAALEAARRAGVSMQDVDFIGSHGQTIYHIPRADPARDWRTPSTLQIADPCVIAERTGVLTVGDFRVRDMVAGGVGAPLIPFADAFLFAHPDEDRLCQNIGGIANCTLLRRDGILLAFDSGPGNMIMDALIRRSGSGQHFDADGALARQGRVIPALLQAALTHPYFAIQPPKATGHELFGEAFVDWFVEQSPQALLTDRLATACELTAQSIARAYRDFVYLLSQPKQVIVSGGGAKNPFLLQKLQAAAPELQWRAIDEFGLPADAKEAAGFAILAFATLHNIPANVPSATGAHSPVILGKIAPGGKRMKFHFG